MLVAAEEALLAVLSDMSRPDAAAFGVGTSSLLVSPVVEFSLRVDSLSLPADASAAKLLVTLVLVSALLPFSLHNELHNQFHFT